MEQGKDQSTGELRKLLEGAWTGWPRSRMKGQVAFSTSSSPTEEVGIVLRLLQLEGPSVPNCCNKHIFPEISKLRVKRY